MTAQSGGTSIPGMTSLPPNGVSILGDVVLGSAHDTGVPSIYTIFGTAVYRDNPACIEDGDGPLGVSQNADVTLGAYGAAAFSVTRTGDVSAQDYAEPTMQVLDFSASAQPIIEFRKQGTTQFGVDSDGVRVHGKFKTGAAVAHTLGAYSGKSVPIYDEAGTLLGYMPLYA